MEKVFPIRKDKQHLIPAVTHVDGTGRLQSVEKDTNPRYYNLINAFFKNRSSHLAEHILQRERTDSQ